MPTRRPILGKRTRKPAPVVKLVGAPPSPDEVAHRYQRANGGWTAECLAAWGIGWPPPKGWRDKLEAQWHEFHRGRRVHEHQVDAHQRLQQQDLPLPPAQDTSPVIPPSNTDKPPWC